MEILFRFVERLYNEQQVCTEILLLNSMLKICRISLSQLWCMRLIECWGRRLNFRGLYGAMYPRKLINFERHLTSTLQVSKLLDSEDPIKSLDQSIHPRNKWDLISEARDLKDSTINFDLKDDRALEFSLHLLWSEMSKQSINKWEYYWKILIDWLIYNFLLFLLFLGPDTFFLFYWRVKFTH